jgi:hypothetical protein
MKIFLSSQRRILLALLAIGSLFVVTAFSTHAEAHARTMAHYCTLVLDHLHPGAIDRVGSAPQALPPTRSIAPLR